MDTFIKIITRHAIMYAYVSFYVYISIYVYVRVCVRSVAQLCPTLCNPMDCSPPGSSGIFQARILEWVAISYSRGSSWPNDGIHISCISCIGRWILYHCTTWEAHVYACLYINKDYLIIMYSHYMWHGTVLSESGWVSCKCILQSLGQPLTKVKKKKSITDLLGKKRK